MSSPWAKISSPEPVSLDDIISEEIARDLQSKEFEKFAESSSVELKGSEIRDAFEDETYKSDAAIAKLLQMQYDREHDEVLKRTENKYNGSSKVSISFDNYRRAPLNDDFDSDSEEEELEDLKDRKDWDRFDTNQREFASIPPCGYKMKNGKIVTKHDGTINGRMNACKLLSFPPEFQTGDGADFDLKLTNKVYNSLKMYSKHEEARRYKNHDKKRELATEDFGVDEYTNIQLFKLIDSKQLLEKVNGVISVGKESVIIHGECNPSYPDQVLPPECAIKVFKTTLSEFKQRDKYIKDDYRFKDRVGSKQNTRSAVSLWAEKEMRNLDRLKKAGIACPEVLMLRKHILVMSFIGAGSRAAPKLKDANLSNAEYIIAYEQVVRSMKTLYDEANLIHADLSEYNILWWEDKCFLIDVSQSVEPNHENAFVFLKRDCDNITNFFQRKGVPEVPSADDLFESITGCSYRDRLSWDAIRQKVKVKPHLVDRPDHESSYRFEAAWVQSKEQPEGVGNAVLVEQPKA